VLNAEYFKRIDALNCNHSDRADVRFARPNIQIYDAHVVDLYQWACARYLVGAKGADTKAKRDLNSALDRISEQIPTDFQPKTKADFVRELSDEAIAEHTKHAAQLPTMHSTMHLYPIDGRAGRIKNSDTPWCYRDAKWAQVMDGVDPDPANKEKISAWAKDYWNALHPHSAGGACVNFMMDEGDDRIRATYGKNYARLAKIKKRYDPTNLFRVNQNIKPA
jgi:hypothetical protein